jgi:hypothetical protein
MIITWTCGFCGWNNDNNNGACRSCGGQTEERMIDSKWRTVTVKPPRDDREGRPIAQKSAGVLSNPHRGTW